MAAAAAASQCIFCQIASKSTSTTLLHTDDKVVAFQDICPAAVRHYLVIPVDHIPTVKDLQRRPEDYSLVNHMLEVGKTLIQRDAPQCHHYRCTGVYGSGGDGDSRADLYSDPLSPRSIWFHLLATAAIQQSEKSRTKWNLCRAMALLRLRCLHHLFPVSWSCFPCLGAAMIVVGLWWLICGGFMFHLSLMLFCLLGSLPF